MQTSHSIQTTVVNIHNTAHAVDSCFVSELVLLDLSNAFDTVDLRIFLDLQQARFNSLSSAHEWYHSHLSNRSQTVDAGDDTYSPLYICYGVPQGLEVGLSCFVAYTKELVEIVKHFSITLHPHANGRYPILSSQHKVVLVATHE